MNRPDDRCLFTYHSLYYLLGGFVGSLGETFRVRSRSLASFWASGSALGWLAGGGSRRTSVGGFVCCSSVVSTSERRVSAHSDVAASVIENCGPRTSETTMMIEPNSAKAVPGAAVLALKSICSVFPSIYTPDSGKTPLTNSRYPRTIQVTPVAMIARRYKIECKASTITESITLSPQQT